jgi:hypothetical protein
MIMSILAAAVLLMAVLAIALPYLMAFGIRHMPSSRFIIGGFSAQQKAVRLQVVTTFLEGMAQGLRMQFPLRPVPSTDLYFLQPFQVEGACAGLCLACLLRPWRAPRRLNEFLETHQRYRFLLVLGAGFARGIEQSWRGPLRDKPRISTDRLEALFADGYGFQQMVFHYEGNRSVLEQGRGLEGKWRAGFYEGAGRALWFLAPNVKAFTSAISALPAALRAECEMGYGIAAGFAGLRQVLETQREWAEGLTQPQNFYLGLVTGLFARYDVNPEYTMEVLQHQGLHALSTLVERVHHVFEELWAKGTDYYAWRDEMGLMLEASWKDIFGREEPSYRNVEQTYARENGILADR